MGLRRPVWVKLGTLLPFPTEGPPPKEIPTDALELYPDAPGTLKAWVQSRRGTWIGLVDYEVKYADGRKDVFHAKDQWVPVYALRAEEIRA